jgi:hypothetical protein
MLLDHAVDAIIHSGAGHESGLDPPAHDLAVDVEVRLLVLDSGAVSPASFSKISRALA